MAAYLKADEIDAAFWLLAGHPPPDGITAEILSGDVAIFLPGGASARGPVNAGSASPPA